MIVRDAARSDEPAIVALWRTCGLAVGSNDPAADLRFALDGPASTVLVGMIGDTIVGAIMVGHDGHRGWLYYVGTMLERRGQGVGRALVNAAETWLARRNVPKLHVMIRDTNADVVGFYAKLGFDVVPRIVMQKRL